MKVEKVEKDVRSKITKYDMHVSCLFVICIIIKDIDNTIQQSNIFHLSYMTVIIIQSKNVKQKKLKRAPMSEANSRHTRVYQVILSLFFTSQQNS